MFEEHHSSSRVQHVFPRGSSSISYTFIVWKFTPTRPAVVGGTPVKAGVAIRTFHIQHYRTVVHQGGFAILVAVGQCFSLSTRFLDIFSGQQGIHQSCCLDWNDGDPSQYTATDDQLSLGRHGSMSPNPTVVSVVNPKYRAVK